MGLQLNLDIKRLFPFVLFRSLAQVALWLATVAGFSAVAFLLIHPPEKMHIVVIGGILGSLLTWIPMLPFELRIEPMDIKEGLAKVHIYLARSNLTPSDSRSQIGPEKWVSNRQGIKWKGNEVEVSVDGGAIVVRGPRSMIKPLWRNFGRHGEIC